MDEEEDEVDAKTEASDDTEHWEYESEVLPVQALPVLCAACMDDELPVGQEIGGIFCPNEDCFTLPSCAARCKGHLHRNCAKMLIESSLGSAPRYVKE